MPTETPVEDARRADEVEREVYRKRRYEEGVRERLLLEKLMREQEGR